MKRICKVLIYHPPKTQHFIMIWRGYSRPWMLLGSAPHKSENPNASSPKIDHYLGIMRWRRICPGHQIFYCTQLDNHPFYLFQLKDSWAQVRARSFLWFYWWICTGPSQDTILVHTCKYWVDRVYGLHIVFFTFDYRIWCKMCGRWLHAYAKWHCKHQKITLKYENLRWYCFNIS